MATSCGTCGYPVVTGSDIRVIHFDEDIAGAVALFDGDALTVACPCCRSSVRAYSGFAFVDRTHDFAIVWPAAARQAIADLEVSEVVVATDAAGGADAARGSVIVIGSALLLELSKATASGEQMRWAALRALTAGRADLTAAALVPRYSGNHGAEHVHVALALFGMLTAAQAVASDRDVPAALDDALLARFYDEPVLGKLAALAEYHALEADARLGAAFVIAWASDRNAARLDCQAHAAWAKSVLGRLADCYRSESRFNLATQGFVRRTISRRAARDAFSGAPLADLDQWLRAMAFASASLDGWGQPDYGWLPVPVRLDMAGRFAQSGDPATAVQLLAGFTPVDIAMTLFHERMAEIVSSPNGTFATVSLIRTLINVGQPDAAENICMEFAAAVGGLATLGAEHRIALGLAFAHTMLASQKPLLALGACQQAADLIDVSSMWLDQSTLVTRLRVYAMRDLGMFTDALDLATRTLEDPDLSAVHRGHLLVFVATCHEMTGDLEAASAAYAKAVIVFSPYDWPDELIRAYVGQAGLLLERRLDKEAWTAAMLAITLSSPGAADDGALAVAALAATNLGRENAPSLVRRALVAYDKLLERLQAAPGRTTDTLLMKAELLAAVHDVDGLQALADQDVRSWQLATSLTEAYAGQERWDQAHESLEQAWDWIPSSFGPQVGPGSVSAPRLSRGIQEWTAELAFREPSRLLGAAERQSSLVAGLLAWPVDKRATAVMLLRETGGFPDLIPAGTLVVTAVRGRQETVFAAVGRHGTVRLLTMNNSGLDRVRAECRIVTRRSSSRGRPLTRSPAWQRLSTDLGAALRPVLVAFDAILFTGAATVGLPLHLVTIDDVELVRLLPCSSAASLLQLGGLRSRRPRAPSARRRAGIASTPSIVDKPTAQAAFTDGAEMIRRVLNCHFDEVVVHVATEAAPDTVLEMLRTVDLGVLSCHGRADPGFGAHALLLAAEGRLPPKIVSPTSPAALQHLLNWDAIGGPTPDVVVSAACSSSSATTVEGGERIALDRTMLAAGTRLFAGPLWDVAITDSHALAAALIDRATPTGDWQTAWHSIVRERSDDLPAASWGAFVIVGDGGAYRE